MAIGDIKASGGVQQDVVRDTGAGAALARGADGLRLGIQSFATSYFGHLNSEQDLVNQSEARVRDAQMLDAESKFLQFQTEEGQRYTEFMRARSADPAGQTDAYDAEFKTRRDEFLNSLPRHARDQYVGKMEAYRGQQLSSAFTGEMQALDAKAGTQLTDGMNKYGTALKAGQIELEDAIASFDEMVDVSGLPPVAKEEYKRQGRQVLTALEFGTAVENTARGYGTVGEANGQDVVAAGMHPVGRGVLNAIAGRESPGYNVINGGGTFTDYSDHPRTKSANGSTAAGRYQFLASTWDSAKASYERTYGVKVPDFSPEWQDRVALHLAETEFNRRNKSGLTFQQVLANPTPENLAAVRQALGNPYDPNDPNTVVWQGWADSHGGTDAAFVEAVMGERGVAGGGTPAVGAPNVWTDPRYADIPLDQKLQLAGQAQDAYQQQATILADQSKRASEARIKALEDSAYNGEYGLADLPLLKANGQITNADEERAFRKGVEDNQKKVAEGTTFSQKLATGEPLTEKDRAYYPQWLGEETLSGLSTNDPAAQDKLTYGVAKAGFMPREAMYNLLAASSRPETAPEALAYLATLDKNYPTALQRSGMSTDDVARVRLFGQMAEVSMDPRDTYAKLEAMRAVHQNKTPEAVDKEAQKQMKKSGLVTPEAIFSRIETDEWGPSDMVYPKEGPVATSMLLDGKKAYTAGYRATGTEEGALLYMDTYLKQHWGPSEVGGAPRFVRNPPENYYEPVADSYQWLDADVRGTLGLDASTSYALIGDPKTAKEAEEGKLPTYMVYVEPKDGYPYVEPRRWGGRRPDPIMATAEKIRKEAERARLVEEGIAAQEVNKKQAEMEKMIDETFSPEVELLRLQEQQSANPLGVK